MKTLKNLILAAASISVLFTLTSCVTTGTGDCCAKKSADCCHKAAACCKH